MNYRFVVIKFSESNFCFAFIILLNQHKNTTNYTVDIAWGIKIYSALTWKLDKGNL